MRRLLHPCRLQRISGVLVAIRHRRRTALGFLQVSELALPKKSATPKSSSTASLFSRFNSACAAAAPSCTFYFATRSCTLSSCNSSARTLPPDDTSAACANFNAWSWLLSVVLAPCKAESSLLKELFSRSNAASPGFGVVVVVAVLTAASGTSLYQLKLPFSSACIHAHTYTCARVSVCLCVCACIVGRGDVGD